MTSQPSAEPNFPDRLPTPRRSLHTRALLAVVALVAIPTALCGYFTSRYAIHTVEDALVRDSVVLTQTVSHLVEDFINTDRIALLDATLDRLMKDHRIAFLVVTGPNNNIVSHRYNEPLAWHEYQARLTPQERLTPLTLNQSIKLRKDDASALVVRRQLIRKPPAAPPDPAASAVEPAPPAAHPTVFGYLEMGLHDPRQRQMLTDLQDMTLAVVAALYVLCLPLVIWWVRGWITPLQRMLVATLRLGLGGSFQPIEINREDEIGLLARAFNAMAANLSAIQNALVEANEQLEQKVIERTRQFEQANRHLQSEMQEKDQFLRAVSHDLGAPLRNIAGLTSLLLLKHRADMGEEVLGKLQRIAANVKAENELLNDLLELSRIKSHTGRMHQVNLDELVRSIAEALSYDLEHNRIELRIDNRLPTVTAERNRIRQVFQNLIENAIKYMPADAAQRRIHIGSRRIDGLPALYVRDTGSGVAPQDREEIFQVFRRARYSTQRNVPGRGVGLATARAIVERHGGRIWVESEPGRGAAFYFTLDPEFVESTPRRAPADLSPQA